MKYPLILAIALIAVLPAGASAKDNVGIKVENIGRDGDERMYRLECPKGRLTTLAYRFKEGKFCYYTVKGESRCRSTDNVDEAALAACNEL